MQNFVHRGETLSFLAPYNVSSGGGFLAGNIFAVAAFTALSGAAVEGEVQGVFDLAKDTSTFAAGDMVYWDNTNKVATSTTTNNTLIGVADLVQASGTNALGGASGDATVRVRLNAAFPSGLGSPAANLVQTATVNLSAAQLIAMGTTPVAILAAPGAGKAILVDEILFEITRTSTAFTNGGVINFQYHTTTTSVPHSGTIAASVVTGGAGTVQTALGQNTGASGLVIPANEGIDITNATAAFAAGTGTAKVFLRYRVVTL